MFTGLGTRRCVVTLERFADIAKVVSFDVFEDYFFEKLVQIHITIDMYLVDPRILFHLGESDL